MPALGCKTHIISIMIRGPLLDPNPSLFDFDWYVFEHKLTARDDSNSPSNESYLFSGGSGTDFHQWY